MKLYQFDLATAIVPTAQGFSATIDPGWTIGSRPNGGYLLALVTRAALTVAGQPHPLAVSGHFLAPPSTGGAELEARLLRRGRSVSTAGVTLLQQGQPCLEALVSAARLEPGAEPRWRAGSEPPKLPPLDECLPGLAEFPGGGMRVPIFDRVDLRLDPATAGWAKGRPHGRLEVRGWARFRDDRPHDPLGLLQVVDALPPSSFGLGIMSWAPTVALTVYLRDLPAAGWLRCVACGRLLQGGWFDEEVEVWDQRDRMVAQARQLAGARG
ncbi:MAG TPA: thioesterase family protein [Actinomycetes bacterium]|nr:thioesterase family protein [Actinomycetes bacterium]